jgi:hypothetical protein
MKKVYYEKRGRRYYPVSEYDSDYLDSFPKGAHIVMCYPGGKSTRYHIDPAYGPMIAASRAAEDKIREAIHKASEARPQKRKLTEEQAAAWQAMQKTLGDEMFYLQYGSIVDAVEAGIKAMQEEADQLMTHPSVKEAYEHFLFVAKLAQDETRENA